MLTAPEGGRENRRCVGWEYVLGSVKGHAFAENFESALIFSSMVCKLAAGARDAIESRDDVIVKVDRI